MTFTFKNYTPGVYFVALDGDTVGSIRKQSASKWVMYDLTDKPLAVSKTLSYLKTIADCYFQPVESNSQAVADAEEMQYNVPTLEPVAF